MTIKLSYKGWIGFAIYIGYKASYRRNECEYHGIDYNKVVAELKNAGVIQKNKLVRNARAIWDHNMENTLPSQIPHVINKLKELNINRRML